MYEVKIVAIVITLPPNTPQVNSQISPLDTQALLS